MSYRNRYSNKLDSYQQGLSFGDRSKKKDDSKKIEPKHFEKDDDGFKLVGKRKHYNRDERKYNKQDIFIKPSFTKSPDSSLIKSETEISSSEPLKEKKMLLVLMGKDLIKEEIC